MSEGTEPAVEQSSDSFETFDSFDNVAEELDSLSDDWSKPAPEEKQKDEGIKVLPDSQADADGKVIKEDGEKEAEKKEPKKEEKDEEESEEESEEDEVSEEEGEEEELAAKKDIKKLRIRQSEGLFNIEAEATIPVKVDGKMEEVPIQELVNNYSGKTAWDKKFTEIGKEKKALEVEKAALTKQKDSLLTHLNEALLPIKDVNKNPLDSLLYLVEMSGEDPYTAYRRIMEHNLEELGTLLDMSETERELFFHKKKDDLHSNVARKRQEKQQKEQAFNQAIQKVDSLRQSHNVTEDQFVDASEELEEIYKASGLDVDSITEESIVDYASLKPHIEVVKGLVEPYEDNISDGKYGDVVSELSRYLRDGKADEATIKQILKRNFSVEEEVKELNSKVYQKSQKVSGKKVALKEAPKKLESFDDWDD